MEHRIIERDEWGAQYRGGWPNYAAGTPERPLPAIECFLHYPGAKAPPGPDATLEQDIAYVLYLEQIGFARFQENTGWGEDERGLYGAGISYSLILPKSGRILRGHDPGRCSSHTAGHNVTGMGYCVLISDGETANNAQLDAAAWALGEQVRRGELATARFTGGHRDVFPTLCPTDLMYAQIPDFNARAGGTVMAKPAPTRTQLKALATEWKAMGGEWYCTPWDWEAGRCAPGKHGHSPDSMHFKGLAFDGGWPGAPISAMEILACTVFIRHVEATKPYDARWLLNISATNHPDHMHADSGEYNGPSWFDDVRDRGGVLGRDGLDLFLPTTFSWHVPPTNLGFTIAKTVAWQSKMRRAARPFTGKPYYTGAVDGYHGLGSKAATRAFQSDNDLTADAAFGPATAKAMGALLAAKPELSLTQQRYDAIVTMVKASGQTVESYVLQLQKRLLAAGYDPRGLDGSPGQGFQDALGRFQKDHGLLVDYLPGAATWEALRAASVPKPPAVVPAPILPPEPTPPPVPVKTLEERVARYRVGGLSAYDVSAAARKLVLPIGVGIILAARDTPDMDVATQAAARHGKAWAHPVPRSATADLPSILRADITALKPAWVAAFGGSDSVSTKALSTALSAAGIDH